MAADERQPNSDTAPPVCKRSIDESAETGTAKRIKANVEDAAISGNRSNATIWYPDEDAFIQKQMQDDPLTAPYYLKERIDTEFAHKVYVDAAGGQHTRCEKLFADVAVRMSYLQSGREVTVATGPAVKDRQLAASSNQYQSHMTEPDESVRGLSSAGQTASVGSPADSDSDSHPQHNAQNVVRKRVSRYATSREESATNDVQKDEWPTPGVVQVTRPEGQRKLHLSVIKPASRQQLPGFGNHGLQLVPPAASSSSISALTLAEALAVARQSVANSNPTAHVQQNEPIKHRTASFLWQPKSLDNARERVATSARYGEANGKELATTQLPREHAWNSALNTTTTASTNIASAVKIHSAGQTECTTPKPDPLINSPFIRALVTKLKTVQRYDKGPAINKPHHGAILADEVLKHHFDEANARLRTDSLLFTVQWNPYLFDQEWWEHLLTGRPPGFSRLYPIAFSTVGAHSALDMQTSKANLHQRPQLVYETTDSARDSLEKPTIPASIRMQRKRNEGADESLGDAIDEEYAGRERVNAGSYMPKSSSASAEGDAPPLTKHAATKTTAQEEYSSNQNEGLDRRERLPPCNACAKKHEKCSRTKPKCSSCRMRGTACVYMQPVGRSPWNDAKLKAKHSLVRPPLPRHAPEKHVPLKCKHCGHRYDDPQPIFVIATGLYLSKERWCPACKKKSMMKPSDNRDHRTWAKLKV